jgi:hypothetical protein
MTHQYAEDCGCTACHRARKLPQALHLVTHWHTARAPLAEVLAVVPEQAVLILANSRARALNDLRRIEAAVLVCAHPDAATVGELLECYLFNRATPVSTCEASVMNDLAVPNVNTVVSESKSRRDEVGAAWRLLALSQ